MLGRWQAKKVDDNDYDEDYDEEYFERHGTYCVKCGDYVSEFSTTDNIGDRDRRAALQCVDCWENSIHVRCLGISDKKLLNDFGQWGCMMCEYRGLLGSDYCNESDYFGS